MSCDIPAASGSALNAGDACRLEASVRNRWRAMARTKNLLFSMPDHS
ncbi:MAG: hypothetical protein QW182_01225 [Thermosphaera sp.]